MRTLIGLLLVGTVLCQTSFGDVNVVRADAESPFVSVAKSTFYGAVFGSVVSLAIMLVSDSDDGDVFKIGFVSGTALGLGYGIYHVVTRPPVDTPQALLNLTPNRPTRVALPSVRLTHFEKESLGLSANVVHWTF